MYGLGDCGLRVLDVEGIQSIWDLGSGFPRNLIFSR